MEVLGYMESYMQEGPGGSGRSGVGNKEKHLHILLRNATVKPDSVYSNLEKRSPWGKKR